MCVRERDREATREREMWTMKTSVNAFTYHSQGICDRATHGPKQEEAKGQFGQRQPCCFYNS